jgi:hypothetical protein
MQYLVSFASQPHMPHWVMISGAVLVLFGAVGILARRPRRGPTDDTEVARDAEAALFRELDALREEPPPVLVRTRRKQETSAESGRQAARQPRR